MGNERLEEEKLRQSDQLAAMESAAETTDDPGHIERSATARHEPKFTRSAKISFAVLGSVLAGLVLLYLAFGHTSILSAKWQPKADNYVRGGLMITMVFIVARVLEVFAIGRMRSAVSRFNLTRILRLIVGLVVFFIVISILFVNWYTAVVSLGLISLILGFALQTPISSFIGWVYILVRGPYRVGDRIRIGEARGDVIDVGYLDTTLWEFGGEYLSSDHPSGRIIKFPNSTVFNSPVFNYSWPLFPYIWNEIKFNIAYESDLEFVGQTMRQIAAAELGSMMHEQVKVYRDILAKTPVDHLEVQEKPVVLFRVSENTWVEAILRYLVHPKETGRIKTNLTLKLLQALNSQPDKVLFPKSNLR